MKLTLSWLLDYLKLPNTIQSLAKKEQAELLGERLSQIGMELESIEDLESQYHPFIVAEIVDAKKHPDANKLNICSVSTGKDTLQVICGAPNVRKGLKVIFAPVESVIPNGGLAIEKRSIRGVESNGMICSANELLLGDDHDGIVELDDNAPVGEKLYNYGPYQYLKEIIFDLYITPNRGDCTNVVGITRDLVASYACDTDNKVLEYDKKGYTSPKSSIKNPISVKIEKESDCYHFTSCYIEAISQPKTPDYISSRMRAIGSSYKGMLVDVSNYAMLDKGRPNHIYDADKITGNITVRLSKKGEKFTAIGGEEYTLPPGLTVISDDNGVLSLAGVIGGEETKVTEDTKNIFIEVAHFDDVAVYKAGRALNIHTDARFRFERRIDWNNTEVFMQYFTSVLCEYGGGKLSNYDIAKNPQKKIENRHTIDKVHVDFNDMNKVLGFDVKPQDARKYFEGLGFEIEESKSNDKGVHLRIPSWRIGDITRWQDFVEEIIRLQGMNKIIPQPHPQSEPSNVIYRNEFHPFRSVMLSRGLHESISLSFMDSAVMEQWKMKNYIKIPSPVSQDMNAMRLSTIPNLLSGMLYNVDRGEREIDLFEWGHIYGTSFHQGQKRVISGLRYRYSEDDGVHNRKICRDFFDVKGDIMALLEETPIGSERVMFTREVPDYYHPHRSAALTIGKKIIGYCGEISPLITKEYKIHSPVAVFELFLDDIPGFNADKKNTTRKAIAQISPYQAVTRHFSFVVNSDKPAGDLLSAVRSVDKNILRESSIFSLYELEDGSSKKSVSISVTLQHNQKTLSEEEIQDFSNKVTEKVSTKCGAELR